MQLRPSIFWNITWRNLVVVYRSFKITHSWNVCNRLSTYEGLWVSHVISETLIRRGSWVSVVVAQVVLFWDSSFVFHCRIKNFTPSSLFSNSQLCVISVSVHSVIRIRFFLCVEHTLKVSLNRFSYNSVFVCYKTWCSIFFVVYYLELFIRIGQLH